MSDGLQVIHAVARVSQQDVLFLCDDEWSLATLDTRGLPPGCYWADNGRAFTFEGAACTCVDCLERKGAK